MKKIKQTIKRSPPLIGRLSAKRDFFILDDNHHPQAVSMGEWAAWLAKENGSRIVAQNKCNGISVSTVFLGIDHSFGASRPLLFETMVFGLPDGEIQERCSTWDEALVMHQKYVAQFIGDTPVDTKQFHEYHKAITEQ